MRILLTLILGLMVLPAQAKDRQTYAMGMPVFKAIEQANTLMEEEQSQEAIAVLNKRLEKRNSPYERAQMNYLLASYYFRLEDQSTAMVHFTKVLESKGKMPVMLHQQTLKTLMQLHMVKEEFEQARDYGLRLVKVMEEPNPQDYGLLAQVYYKLSDWDASLKAGYTAMDIYQDQMKTPDENLLLIINASHFEMQQYAEMIEVLNVLVKHYPKDTYILYLASIYGQMEQHEPQVALLESLYDDGRISDEGQLKTLASLYLSMKVPFKSAELLSKAIDDGEVEKTSRNYEFLSQAWQLAAENARAIDAIGMAAELDTDGELYLRMAYLLFDSGEWSRVSKVTHLALDKGLEQDKQGEAWLLLGMTLLQVREFDQALDACQKAADFKDSRKLAQQWISYISSEQEKYLAYAQVTD